MPTVYPTAAGAWSTRTWNNDATGLPYGGPPQPSDTVLANGLAITIDVDITVESLSTRPGTTAVAGGSFTTSGARTVNADSYAGTTNCLILASNSGSVQNGNSYGSNSTNTRYGTTVNATCIQNGNSFGGNGSNRTGTLINGGGIQNGNSTGGSGMAAAGTVISAGGIQNGNSTGGTTGSAFGTGINAGGIQNGNSTGGTASGAHGTNISAGGIAIIGTATGTTPWAFGVQSTATNRYFVLIKNEVGAFAKSLTSAAETTDANVPFVNYGAGSGGGGGSSESISCYVG